MWLWTCPVHGETISDMDACCSEGTLDDVMDDLGD